MGLNVFYDLVDYSSQIDAIAMQKAEGKNVTYSTPMTLAEMTKQGNLRG